MYVAKKEFPFRGKKYKKGEEVRVSSSIAETLKGEGKIELKAKEIEKEK